tara:strand:+ start:1998 stop:2708 length:711 start_codon:yes stop_codon:yes gene_type:complete
MTDYGNRMMPMEIEEKKIIEVAEAVAYHGKPLEEEPIFNKPEKKKRVMTDEAKAKLVDRLKLGREKSLQTRRANAEEKKKNKKPVGRPKKTKIPITEKILDDGTKLSYPTPEPEQPIKEEIVMEIKEEELPKKKPIQQHTNIIDYDKIINGIYNKMKPPVPQPSPAPRQQVSRQEIEARIRADERIKIKQEQDLVFRQKKNEKEQRLKNATQKYYSKLPQPNFFEPTNWDNLFNPR